MELEGLVEEEAEGWPPVRPWLGWALEGGPRAGCPLEALRPPLRVISACDELPNAREGRPEGCRRERREGRAP